jgi:hypothetical protein
MTLDALDVMAGAWAAVMFLGLWLIWPALSVFFIGALGLGVVLLLAWRRKGGEA